MGERSGDSIEEEREFLLRSIADLDAEYAAGDLDEDDYTARAAAALRSVSTSSQPFAKNTHRTKKVVVGAAVVAAALGAGWLVASSAGERIGNDPGSGGIEQASTDRIARAQALVQQGRVLDAIKVYDDLLADDPENPVALAERGWLISRVDPTLADRGLESIDKAIAVDAGYPEAYFYRGMILRQIKGDEAGAQAAFAQALANDPPPDLRAFLQGIQAEAQSGDGSPPASP